MENRETALSLQNICFSYKTRNENSEKHTIENFNLDVDIGSFTTLLGPSGCGKTTLLRLISGFLEPDSGKILVNNTDMCGIYPEDRYIGMVFQDYALFPHMTVKQNIMYGLKTNRKQNKLSKAEMEAKVLATSETLDLQNLLERYPHELSGGQQQRVALARALVLNPKILLMDEPLSSLDTKLREKVREELKEIQQKLGITTIYVTHDQDEALSLSDKIAVINEGKLLQVDSPRDIYFKPADKFTADFIGRANFFEIDGFEYLVRPDWFILNKTEEKGDLEGTVLSTSFLGDKTRFKILCGEKTVIADLPTLESNFLEAGGAVSLKISHKWKLDLQNS